MNPEWESAYVTAGKWLAILAAWRALWPKGDSMKLLEVHFSSLVGCFGVWGATAALLERPVTAVVGALMVVLTVCRTLAGSLFTSQPLVRAGVLGLGAGVAILALIVRVGDDIVEGGDP